jgi:hypothetical protein
MQYNSNNKGNNNDNSSSSEHATWGADWILLWSGWKIFLNLLLTLQFCSAGRSATAHFFKCERVNVEIL